MVISVTISGKCVKFVSHKQVYVTAKFECTTCGWIQLHENRGSTINTRELCESNSNRED